MSYSLENQILVCILTSLFVAFFSAPLLRKLALRWKFLDTPGDRKLQKEPIPLLGGAAVYLGVLAGILTIPSFDPMVFKVLVAGSLIFIISLVDDRRSLSAKLRIVVQLVAAAIVIASGVRISFLPNHLLGHLGEILITLLWILGITNAFNYLDGIDGLCVGLGAVTTFFFFVNLFATGQQLLLFLPLAVISSCLGFLPHNLKEKKMYLGDAGSMFIGFLVACIAISGNWASDNMIKIAIPILILGVPIFDMCFTTVMRYREKKIRTVLEWLEYSGKDHFHHYLIDLGLHSGAAALFICAISVSMGITAFILTKSDHALYGVLAILVGLIMFGVVGVLMVLGRRIHRDYLVKERMGI